MKKCYSLVAVLGLLVATACGGGSNESGSSQSESGSSENANATSTNQSGSSVDQAGVTVTPVPANAEEELNQYVDLTTLNGTVISKDKKIELKINPKIKSATTDQVLNSGAAYAILYDADGNEIIKLTMFGGQTQFNDALREGDTSFDGSLTISKSGLEPSEAGEMVKKAKTYALYAPLKFEPIPKRITERKNGTAPTWNDWNPVGVYRLVDKYGEEYTLTVEDGGKAILLHNRYAGEDGYNGTDGTWKQDAQEGFVKFDFWKGPFIDIADHSTVSSPILTPDSFYYDMNAFEDYTDFLPVEKQ